MHVVSLGFFVEVPELAAAVDHAGVHGDGLFEDFIDEAFDSGMAHGVDASFGEGEVDGFGEVQGGGGWVSEVCACSRISVSCSSWLWCSKVDPGVTDNCKEYDAIQSNAQSLA